jgi:hypothetical protein
MPNDIEGLSETLSVLKNVHRVVYDQMNDQIKDALREIQNDAKTLVPNSPPPGLSKWASEKPNTVWYRLAFDPSEMKSGIRISLGRQKMNRRNFVGMYSILNTSAPGMVYEVAGSRNPNGRPHYSGAKRKNARSKAYSQSDNPNAGKWFIDRIERQSGIVVRFKQGRLVIAAGMRKEKKTRDRIITALDNASRLTYTKLPNLRG